MNNTSSRDNHLFTGSTKRILSLDGGGVRGIFTLQVLKEIETTLSAQHKKDIRLSDYFDLIGGTSTGAIIATALALGWRVDKIIRLYMELAESVFESEFFRRGLIRAKFDSAELNKQLKNHFGNITLGSGQIHTGLAIMLKRLDTGSPWILSNNPKGKYYGPREGRTTTPNKDFLLRRIVRASAAAPTFFEPECLKVSGDLHGAFVDGGVSPHNNPALKLFMLSTVRGYGLQWPVGDNRIMLVSVGTGMSETITPPEDLFDSPAAALGVRALTSLMADTSALNETILQWISTSPTKRTIDREIGNLSSDTLGSHPLLTYLRYDAWLEKNWLKQNIGMDLNEEQVTDLDRLDKPANMHKLKTIGTQYARKFVNANHFPTGFKITTNNSTESNRATNTDTSVRHIRGYQSDRFSST